MWILLAFGSAFFAGITAILAKLGIKDMDSHLATALRTVVVLIFAWLMVFLKGTQSTIRDISGASYLFLALSGLATGGSWLCYFRALQCGDVNKVVPIDKSSTILTMLGAFLILGEPITGYMILGMGAIAVGTALMIQKKAAPEARVQTAGAKNDHRWLVYAILSAVFASLTSILGKIGMENVDSTLGTALRTIVVLFMAWLIVCMTHKQKEIGKIDGRSWIFLILSGVTTGLSWLCYYRALQTGKASIVVPIDKLSIVVSVAFAWIVFKEKLSPKGLAGLILIVAGTLILLL
ncbi:EamA family transporter [Frisingicoccus sp.]|uniref:EamA family transporter n=1 Tax=Frisingicoccus sp. TaxID=1918627 RepID=UPI003AB84700